MRLDSCEKVTKILKSISYLYVSLQNAYAGLRGRIIEGNGSFSFYLKSLSVRIFIDSMRQMRMRIIGMLYY